MAFTLIDTDVLIDAARNDASAVACLQRIEQQSALAISAITQMELIIGCRNKGEIQQLELFLARFQVLRITDLISDRAVGLLRQYRLSHGLLIADAFIAATTLEYGEPLLTKNQRDFRFIAGLNLHPYP